MARRTRTWRGRRPLACTETSCAGLGRPCVWPCPSQHGPHGEPQGHDHDARTQGVGQFPRTSEATEQREPGAMKNTQAQAATAEVVEGRELAKGNSGQQNRVRTQCRAALSRALDRVRQAARESAIRLTALWHHVDSIDRLREAYNSLKHHAAPGGRPDMGHLRRATRNQPSGVSDRLKRGALRPHRSSASTCRKLMVASDPSARRRWKTKSSSGRQSRCSTLSTRKSFSGSRTVPAQAAARTTRWMRLRAGLKSATATGYSMPTCVASTRRLTMNGW